MLSHINNNQVRIIAVWVVITLIASGCSTQRNTWLNRNFHQINTLYNGLFNARESYRQGLRSLATAHEDNFDLPLSIFQYGTPDQRQAIRTDMEITYQKAGRVIGRHSMFIRNVEHNRLIDDAYFLIAKSQFFRGNYAQSLATFQYIARSFQAPLTHKSMIWQAKVRAFTGNNIEASRLLSQVAETFARESADDTEAGRLYNLVNADLAFRMDNLSDAATHLLNAIELTRNRRDKARLTFILGQYYQVLEQPALASRYFDEVLQLPSGFELAFHARLGLAYNSIAAGGNPKAFSDELHKMLRQGRYRLYHGRIHYALAMMSVELTDTLVAIEQFRKAAHNSDNDRAQKGQAYYNLGKLYFALNDFIPASKYYDSAMVYLAKGTAAHERVLSLQTPLRQIAENLTIIHREDSLQKLARLPEAERLRIVEEISQKIQKTQSGNMPGDRVPVEFAQGNRAMEQGVGRQGADWYFYNPVAMRSGKEEFERKFGHRSLEDFWRLSNRTIVTDEFTEQLPLQPRQESGDDTQEAGLSALLANIPLTQQQIDESNLKIANAYYALGVIFKERLNDVKNAAEAFQKLAGLNVSTENTPVALYNLVRIYLDQGDVVQSEKYQTLLIFRYPDSPFAKIFSRRNELHSEMVHQKMGNQIYQKAFEAFESHNYHEVLAGWAATDTLLLSQELMAQFEYLKALALYQLGRRQEAMDLLGKILTNYEGTRVYAPARLLINALEQRPVIAATEPAERAMEVDEVFRSVFTFNPNQVHFFIFVVDTRSVDPAMVMQELQNLNNADFRASRLTISNIFFQQNENLVAVTSFPNKEEAIAYFRKATELPALKKFSADHATAFVISIDNYPVFYQEKNVVDYLHFFRRKYF